MREKGETERASLRERGGISEGFGGFGCVLLLSLGLPL